MEDIYHLNRIIFQKLCLGSWQELADTPLGKEADLSGSVLRKGRGSSRCLLQALSSFLGSYLPLNLMLHRGRRCLSPEPLELCPAARAPTQSSGLPASASWGLPSHLR